ncbi:hypothetical protein K2173_007384 [Erythroxylum novogranatense]|uniref:Tubby-like F-box protein n=1 Tax=Erythroxylum novogranatense TaxID=1862640 RepID=A0AAV8T7M7_9ROSI|nr:hypothetical protein K2173_007384 [Erythroxylum novogranatense]
MPFKSIVRELKEIRDDISASSLGKFHGKRGSRRGRAYIAPEGGSECDCTSCELIENRSPWANLPPELLHNIIQRVEASETSWPGRRDVVSCASVCKSWREITKEIVKTPEQCGWLTFPISLKQVHVNVVSLNQFVTLFFSFLCLLMVFCFTKCFKADYVLNFLLKPGPRDPPIQCFIKRDRATSTYQLYLGLSPALSGDLSKLLLSAKKIRRAMFTDFRISLVNGDFCRNSNTYVGSLRYCFEVLASYLCIRSLLSFTKLTCLSPSRSNFLGTKFTICDSQPPHVHLPKYRVAKISYELNVLRTRGPRRMRCTMQSIPVSAIQEGGSAPTPREFTNCHGQQFLSGSNSKAKWQVEENSSTSLAESLDSIPGRRDPLILKNKAPRWHEQLQCWCLNFKGRVTVASVKNFQLVASVEPSQNVSAEEQEKVILQFGKIGKDIFTMDYRYPLSAFQAFAICLSSFDTKPACE